MKKSLARPSQISPVQLAAPSHGKLAVCIHRRKEASRALGEDRSRRRCYEEVVRQAKSSGVAMKKWFARPNQISFVQLAGPSQENLAACIHRQNKEAIRALGKDSSRRRLASGLETPFFEDNVNNDSPNREKKVSGVCVMCGSFTLHHVYTALDYVCMRTQNRSDNRHVHHVPPLFFLCMVPPTAAEGSSQARSSVLDYVISFD